MDINDYILEKQKLINHYLEVEILSIDMPAELQDALKYAISTGGKRLRPILMLAAYEAFKNIDRKVIIPAIALELIHTYSLIHDDLPAMDDDDLRRGMKTVHKQYDEATAILIGDGLLTYAFHLVSGSKELEAEEKIYIINQLSRASGFEGMIAGQFLDLKAENQTLTEKELITIHRKKTGELIRAAVKIGSYLGKATPPQIEALDSFGDYLGLIFQIQDDILDVTGLEDEMGKPIGSDEANHKSTYPSVLGLKGAEDIKQKYIEKATNLYYDAKINQPILLELINLFGNRSY
ncbi:polyprenyl synthetase family protein [Bacillaceae bacterium W0354]